MHIPMPVPLVPWNFNRHRRMLQFAGGPYPNERQWRKAYGDDVVPFLDEPNPPAFNQFGIWRRLEPASLSVLRRKGLYSPAGMERLEGAIRRVFDLGENSVLDQDDPYLVMQAWEARNYQDVCNLVRHLADSRWKSLEEFEWYVLDEVGTDSMVWTWKIHRREDGSVRLVNGTLTWSGCLRGNPAPFPVYVGQELEYTRWDAGGRYDACVNL